MANREENKELIDLLAEEEILCGCDCPPCAHECSGKKGQAPILIGTVLDSGEMQVAWTVEQRKEKRDKLLDLWDECGFTTSFQDIINESGWEEEDNKIIMPVDMCVFGGEPAAIRTEQLKDPNTRALAEFLISIFLTK